MCPDLGLQSSASRVVNDLFILLQKPCQEKLGTKLAGILRKIPGAAVVLLSSYGFAGICYSIRGK
jgi:hypothetical protein